jgi:uncharacterized cupredoxin-like copper-binding protein
METRSEVKTSLQIAVMGVVANLANADFKITNEKGPVYFLVKNDGLAQVSLQIKTMKGEDWITTNFDPGWNPELVWKIKQNAAVGLDLKYGY